MFCRPGGVRLELRRSLWPRTIALFCLLLPLTSCREPGYRANGLTRQGVSALQAGVSEQQIEALLGPPVERVVGAHEILLAYAKPSHRRIGSKRFGEEGLTFVVFVEQGRLKAAHVYDPPAVCSCDARACPPDWSKACLSLFPHGGGPPSGQNGS